MRYFLCLCESDTTHERTESAGPHPPPTNLHPPPRKYKRHPHTCSHLRPPCLSTAPTLFLSPPNGFSLCPSLLLLSSFFFFLFFFKPSLEDEREDVSGVCVCVLVMFRLIQGQQQHKQGETQAQAGIGCFVHIC